MFLIWINIFFILFSFHSGGESNNYNHEGDESKNKSCWRGVEQLLKSNLYRVPQGLILGPILFNIFINDIPKINSLPELTTSTTIYADDVQLLFSGTPNNLEQLKIYAETSLKTMKEWYSENGLKRNSNKTQCILFATQSVNKWIETFQIIIDDTSRHMEDEAKNLGV